MQLISRDFASLNLFLCLFISRKWLTSGSLITNSLGIQLIPCDSPFSERDEKCISLSLGSVHSASIQSYTTNMDGSYAVAVLKIIIFSFNIILGLSANLVGFIASFNIRLTFPTTRLLFRLQFIIDSCGCIVSSAYWITISMKIPQHVLFGSLFSYIWTSFYAAMVINAVSGNNMILLSIDRYWAVVRFRTYRRDSKWYRAILLIVSYSVVICFTTPTPILSYYLYHPQLIEKNTLILFTLILAIAQLLVFLIIPTILISVLQVRILMVIKRARRCQGTNELSTSGSDHPSQGNMNQTTMGISMAIIIMLITFVLSRSYQSYSLADVMFNLTQEKWASSWKNEWLLPFSFTFCLNPLALIFTSSSARGWLFKRFVLPIRSFFTALSIHSSRSMRVPEHE